MYDQNGKKTVEQLLLYLTFSEAKELMADLARLTQNPKDNHAHVSDEDYRRELTVSIYDPADLSGFDDLSKRVILG